MLDTQQETEVINMQEFEFEVPCNSVSCEERGKGDHAADWIVLGSCGCIYDWCNERFMRATHWQRTAGCAYDECAPVHGVGVWTIVSWAPLR